MLCGVLCRVFWMVEASIHMCMCEIIVGVVLATQMDPVTGVLSQPATIGLIVVVSAFSVECSAPPQTNPPGVLRMRGRRVSPAGLMCPDVCSLLLAADQHETSSGCYMGHGA